jgi:hypothetical protein
LKIPAGKAAKPPRVFSPYRCVVCAPLEELVALGGARVAAAR